MHKIGKTVMTSKAIRSDSGVAPAPLVPPIVCPLLRGSLHRIRQRFSFRQHFL